MEGQEKLPLTASSSATWEWSIPGLLLRTPMAHGPKRGKRKCQLGRFWVSGMGKRQRLVIFEVVVGGEAQKIIRELCD